MSYIDRIKCINIGERSCSTVHSFSGIFASVLGSDTNKQDRPVSRDVLLVSLLKLLGKLVQTPMTNYGDASVIHLFYLDSFNIIKFFWFCTILYI